MKMMEVESIDWSLPAPSPCRRRISGVRGNGFTMARRHTCLLASELWHRFENVLHL